MYNHEPPDYNCPFCNYVLKVEQAHFVYQDENIAGFISSARWPQNTGIVILIPNKHIENIYDMPDELLAKIHALAKKIALAMKKGYQCDGVSIRQHNEPAGNQEVMHYHFQILPRYTDDKLYISHLKKSGVSMEDRAKFAEIIKENLDLK
jgi:histidine triad (HIT) family protein